VAQALPLRKRLRSQLYVPGDSDAKRGKALSRGADAVVLDLEDAVAPERKASARRDTRDWLLSQPAVRDGPTEIWARVNPGKAMTEDLQAVATPALSGVCLAKAEGPEDVRLADKVLSEAEKAAGLEPGSVAIVPLLESATAVLAMREIARAPRVTQLALGEVDLAADLGLELSPDDRELWWVRSQLVVQSAAAGLERPIGSVWTDLDDLDGLRTSSLELRRFGYGGRSCIHPAQVPVVNEVFTPGQADLQEAQALVERFDAALAAGEGVIRDNRGRMVDEAVVKAARRLLATGQL
jgi:citrate lyase subunit beta/citryl-CoA lyase